MPAFRNGRIAAAFWLILAAALVAYHLTLIFYGLVPNLVSRPLHMAFILPFVLVFGNTSRWGAISGMFLAALGIAATVWIAINHDRLGDQYGFLESNLQGGIAVTLLLVTNRSVPHLTKSAASNTISDSLII